MIDQQDYQLLKTIGEQGSVQRAASALGVSWPSISKRLAKIESKLKELKHLVKVQKRKYRQLIKGVVDEIEIPKHEIVIFQKKKKDRE